jgi:peptide-methionine (S)-S-oxide reductase
MTQTAIFSTGDVEALAAASLHIEGVVRVSIGYCGGHTGGPTPELVASGRTGHCEAALIEYDDSLIYYEELLDVFFDSHDPTDRALAHKTSPKRSLIFTSTREQLEAAQDALLAARSSGRYVREVITQIKPATEFFEHTLR